MSHPALLPALLAALSHELGSPLAAIKGAATTLIDYHQRLLDDRIAGFLHSIDQQTDQLNDLLDDLVLLAKIEAGSLRLQHEAERLARREKVVFRADADVLGLLEQAILDASGESVHVRLAPNGWRSRPISTRRPSGSNASRRSISNSH